MTFPEPFSSYLDPVSPPPLCIAVVVYACRQAVRGMVYVWFIDLISSVPPYPHIVLKKIALK